MRSSCAIEIVQLAQQMRVANNGKTAQSIYYESGMLLSTKTKTTRPQFLGVEGTQHSNELWANFMLAML